MKPELILLNDFHRIPERVRLNLATASREVIESGWYVLGNRVKTFEQDIKSLITKDNAGSEPTQI